MFPFMENNCENLIKSSAESTTWIKRIKGIDKVSTVHKATMHASKKLEIRINLPPD